MPKNVRPVTDTLRDLRQGKTMDEMSELLNKIVEQVVETGKTGKLTLTLTIKPATKHNRSMIQISDDITAKVPQFDRSESIFFATVDNNLQRQDPNQVDAFKPQPVRTTNIDTETGEVTNGSG